MTLRRTLVVVALVASLGLIVGCGSTRLVSKLKGTSTSASEAAPSKTASPVSVIRNWANALQRGDIHGAAAYFALPSVFANGDGSGGLGAVEIHTEHQAELVNESLTCGAKVISTSTDGKYIAVLFRLTNREGAGADCESAAGEEASTDFVIKHGRIVEWVRAVTGAGGTTPAANPNAPGDTI